MFDSDQRYNIMTNGDVKLAFHSLELNLELERFVVLQFRVNKVLLL